MSGSVSLCKGVALIVLPGKAGWGWGRGKTGEKALVKHRVH